MREYFQKCFNYLNGKLPSDGVLLANLSAEVSDFCRFNNAKVRQLGSVKQCQLGFRFVKGRKQTLSSTELSMDFEIDKLRLDKMQSLIEQQIEVSDEDPYILYNEKVQSSEQVSNHQLPLAGHVIDAVQRFAGDVDFVGIYAAGSIIRGFMNSLGQVNWYESQSFNLDWSLYLRLDKAVKGAYAGFTFDENVFKSKIEDMKVQLAVLDRPPKKIIPGKYNTYLAPAAISEIFDLLNWEGFSLKKVKSMQSPLIELCRGDVALAKGINLSENIEGGIAPNFDDSGFIKPASVSLIDGGKYISSLVSARSAVEFQTETTGAGGGEQAESLAMGSGDIAADEILSKIGTGLLVNNLWYMNYSDRQSCRLTGMTRFATLWVEGGEVVAPVEVMRFDDCFYDMFGKKLVGLTADQSFLIGNMTYDKRETSTKKLPGALIQDFELTL